MPAWICTLSYSDGSGEPEALPWILDERERKIVDWVLRNQDGRSHIVWTQLHSESVEPDDEGGPALPTQDG